MPTGSVLIAYTTSSGSTEEVAKAIGEELSKSGLKVEVQRLEKLASVEPYDAVIVGAPMIIGWHRAARRFVRRHREALSRVPVAYFFMAMSLTETGETAVDGIPVLVDPYLPQPPRHTDRLSRRERYASVSNYLRPVLKAAPRVKPISAAFFGGSLDLMRLKLLSKLFVMLVIQATPGDLRNWPFIRDWATNMSAELLKSTKGQIKQDSM